MIIDVQQNTPEWLAARLGRFTACDAQCIATNGKGLETLCFEKAAEVMTGKGKEAYTNEDMERGHELESEARSYYELETGYVVKETGFWVMDDMMEVGCSPDGIVTTDGHLSTAVGLVEIKCPSDVTFARYLYDGKVDPKYYAQMQMQMGVTGKDWVDYVVYNPNFDNPIVIKRIERDHDFIIKLSEGLKTGVAKLSDILGKIRK